LLGLAMVVVMGACLLEVLNCAYQVRVAPVVS